MPRPLRRRKTDPTPPTPNAAPPAPQEAASSPAPLALTPDALANAYARLLASGAPQDELAAVYNVTAWAHGLMSAMIATARDLPAADYYRLAQGSRGFWQRGVEDGLTALARNRASSTAARNRINRVFHLDDAADTWAEGYESEDRCDDSNGLNIPQARCCLISDYGHDESEAA